MYRESWIDSKERERETETERGEKKEKEIPQMRLEIEKNITFSKHIYKMTIHWESEKKRLPLDKQYEIVFPWYYIYGINFGSCFSTTNQTNKQTKGITLHNFCDRMILCLEVVYQQNEGNRPFSLPIQGGAGARTRKKKKKTKRILLALEPSKKYIYTTLQHYKHLLHQHR